MSPTKLEKTAISATVVRRALRSRQARNLAARALGALPKNGLRGSNLDRFTAANSRTPIARQLLNARRGVSSIAPARPEDSEQISRVFAKLLNRKEAPNTTKLVERLRYALGSARPASMTAINNKTPGFRQRVRGAVLAGRGNLDLVKDKNKLLRHVESSSGGAVYETGTGHRVELGHNQALPGLINIKAFSQPNARSLNASAAEQQLGAFTRRGYSRAWLNDLRKALKGVKDPVAAGEEIIKRLPNNLSGAGDMHARLGAARRTLPRSFALQTTPGHNQVRALYNAAGFMPLADGSMVLPGGSYKLPGTKLDLMDMYKARRAILTANPEQLARYGVDPASASLRSMLRNPGQAHKDSRRLAVGMVRDSRSNDAIKALQALKGTERYHGMVNDLSFLKRYKVDAPSAAAVRGFGSKEFLHAPGGKYGLIDLAATRPGQEYAYQRSGEMLNKAKDEYQQLLELGRGTRDRLAAILARIQPVNAGPIPATA